MKEFTLPKKEFDKYNQIRKESNPNKLEQLVRKAENQRFWVVIASNKNARNSTLQYILQHLKQDNIAVISAIQQRTDLNEETEKMLKSHPAFHLIKEMESIVIES